MGKFTIFNSAKNAQASLKTPASGSRIFRLYKIWNGNTSHILTAIADKPAEISISTGWEDAGGAALAKKLESFADNLIIQVLRGSSYESYVPSGKWTQQRATSANVLSASVDLTLFSTDMTIPGSGNDMITNYTDAIVGGRLFDSVAPPKMALSGAINNAMGAIGQITDGTASGFKDLTELQNGITDSADFGAKLKSVAGFADNVIASAAQLRGVPTFTFDYGNIFKSRNDALNKGVDWCLKEISITPSQNFVLSDDTPKPIYIKLSLKFETVCALSAPKVDLITT